MAATNEETNPSNAPVTPEGTGKRTKRKKKVRTPEEKRRRKKKRRIILLSIIVVLVVFRLLLPWIVLRYVNNKLANLEEYYGHVDDIDIHLYRGAYVIKDINIVRKESKGTKIDTIPFFKSDAIDLSVEWKALFKGAIVGEIAVEKPVVNFVNEAHKGEDVKADTADFKQLIDDLMPIRVNRFDIHQGQIHYRDMNSSPKLDLAIRNLNVTATNLTNVTDSKELLPATAKATAEAYDGKLDLDVKFDALAEKPTFDLTTNFTGINLVKLNPMLQAYGNFDVKKGTFSMYAEFAGKKGTFGGYVKPVLKDLDVVQWNKEEGDFKQIVWETVVGVTAELLQNQKKEQLATKIPINGSFDKVNVNIWRAISYVLRNAFFQAIKPSVDYTININQMKEGGKKTLLERVFGDKDKDKSDKKDKKAKKKKKK
jgi:hypothetical protein